jgi:type I restriction enzyme M protein
LFLDKANTKEVVLIDASNLGTKVKDGKNQKTVLSSDEEQQIIDIFNAKEIQEDFSVVVSYDAIKEKNYSLSAGQYFEVKIEYIDISAEDFATKMTSFENTLETLFAESKNLEKDIQTNLKSLKYD